MTNEILPASLSILLSASLVIFPLLRYFYIRPLDEGFYAYPAYLIHEGEHPYRDFYLGYTPGKTYLLALLFKLFGPTLITARYYYAAVTILLSFEIVWLTYLTVPGVLTAWFAGLLFIIYLFPRRELYYATAVETGMFSDRTVIAVLLMLTVITANNNQSQPLFFLSGLLLSLTLFFAQEAGIWAAVSVLLYLLSDIPDGWQISGLVFFSGAASFGVLILLLAFRAKIPFRRIFDECFKEILVLGTGSCRRRYPSLFSALPEGLSIGELKDFKKRRFHFFVHCCRYWAPPFLSAAAFFLIFTDISEGVATDMDRAVILPLAYGFFASFFTYSWPDYSHVARGVPVHIPVALFTLSRIYKSVSESEWSSLAAEDLFYIYLLLLFAATLLYDVFYGVQAWVLEMKGRKEKMLLEKEHAVYVEKSYYKKIRSLLKKIREEVKPDEKIFAAPADPLICFLLQKRTRVYLKSFLPFNPSHYHTQALLILKTDSVKWIIYNRDQDEETFFPGGATFAGFAPTLYEYISREYFKAFELEGYDVYRKK